MLSIITLPVDFVSSTLAYVGDVFTDVSEAVILVVGLPLAFWFIAKVIALIRGGFRSRSRL